MNVADLRQHLADLSKLLASSAAKGVASDLTAISDGLAPFRELPLKEFAAFLVRAEAFSRGEVPITPVKKPRSGASGSSTKMQAADSPDVAALVLEVSDLYGRAADPSVTHDAIDSFVKRLSQLNKTGVQAVAQAIELKVPKSKSAKDIISAIHQRIVARKGSTQRAGLLDGPTNDGESKSAPS
jgi:hypothetical protein